MIQQVYSLPSLSKTFIELSSKQSELEFNFRSSQEVVNQKPGNPLNEGREALEVPLPISMHTGQIIMLTKMMTSADLRFYEFDNGTPVHRWRSDPSGSS